MSRQALGPWSVTVEYLVKPQYLDNTVKNF